MKGEETKGERIAEILKSTCAVLAIIAAALEVIGVWENSCYAYQPLAGVAALLQAYQFWINKQYGLAIFCLCFAVFCLFLVVIFAAIFFLK